MNAEDKALDALCAYALRVREDDPTPEEVEQFLRDYNEGKHQLSREDADALEKTRKRLMAEIEKVLGKT